MAQAFIGTEAIASGKLTRGQLRWNYSALHPGIYIPKGADMTLLDRMRAAWLRTDRRGVIAGQAAAALHDARWVSPTAPIEVIAVHGRRQPGIIVREERISGDEIVEIAGLPVTSAARTALDLARHFPRDTAVAHLDALAAATSIDHAEVEAIAQRYPGARGIRRARLPLALMDAGAQSPKESWLRMVLFDAGLPRPTTQIKVSDGTLTAFLDMGWEEPKIGLDYDGDQHFSDRPRYVRDIGRYEMVDRQGWIDLRVVAEHSRTYIVWRVNEAFNVRGYSPKSTKWF